MFHELFQETGLSLERLHTLCLVARARGVTRAAGGDPIRQSLFSRQLKELETYFGVTLFARKARGVELTPAGAELAAIAREHLAALTDFRNHCKKRPLKLTIAAGDSLLQWLLLPRLRRLQNRLPNVSLVLLNLRSAEISKRLTDGVLDFGVVRPTNVGPPVASLPLGTVTHSLFVSQFADGPTELKKVFARFPFATLEGDGLFRRELTSAFQKRGIQLNTQIECSSFPLIARLLRDQPIAAVLPTLARTEFGPPGIREIRTSLLRKFDRKIVLAWNTRMSLIRPLVDKASKSLAAELQF